MDISNLFSLAGGVGLFLYGIKLLSEALQSIAGNKMRHLIGTLTRTPLRGVFIGILVTVLIQSSTGTTVMTVSFVNAGLLTLKQAIGIIMGANIGTTVTAQIIAFDIEAFALPIVAVGVGLNLFSRTKRLGYLGSGLLGLGLLFMGMQVMKNATPLLASHRTLLLSLSHNPILGVLAGMILTILIQSSAATIGLTMVLASQGLLDIDAAIPIILGDNLGTTLTAVVVAINATRHAKQAAAAHVLFNLLGIVLFLLCFPLYKALILQSASDVGRQIANAHSIFNVLNTIIFLPFASLFARLIERIIPSEAGTQPEVLFLNPRLIGASSSAAVEAVKDELAHMGDIVKEMLGIVRQAYSGGKDLETLMEDFEKKEKSVNAINQAIASYASEIWQKGVSDAVSTVLGRYVSASSDLERVGDHSENLMELCGPLEGNLSTEAAGEFWDMFDTAELALTTAMTSLQQEDVSLANRVILELEDKIDAQEKQYRMNHIDRLNRGECDPERGVNFIDLLGNLERIGDHSDNIAGYTLDIAGLPLGAGAA